ncbi:glyoxal reductase domain protein, partial [Ancylostoma duodenale]
MPYDEGLIRSVGVSNYESRHIEEIKAYGKLMPCANQVEYHPHFTRDELREYCKKEGVFFQAFSSLARYKPELIEDPAVVAMAKKRNALVPVLLFSWALSQGVGIVPKSATPQRIIDNFE